MNITFGDRKLEKYANNDSLGQRKLGKDRFTRFKRRLDQLRYSTTLEDVRNQPGRFHELGEDRKGQWSCDLDHPYRLIFIPHEDPIPEDDDGGYIWTEILGVEIMEIEDYH